MVEEGYNNSLKEMLEIDLTENQLMDLIEQTYLIMFKEENNSKIEDKIILEEYIADLLILINYLNKKFEKTEKFKEWENIKKIILHIIDSLFNIKALENMKNEIFAYNESRVILCKNMLFSLKDFSIKEISIQNYLKEELEILKQKIFVKPSLNEGILVLQNQLHSEMILKLLEERPDFKAEMKGLKGEAKSKFENLIGKPEKEEKKKEIVQENNDQIEYDKVTYNCPKNSKVGENNKENKELLLLTIYKEFLIEGPSPNVNSHRNIQTIQLTALTSYLTITISKIIQNIFSNFKNNLKAKNYGLDEYVTILILRKWNEINEDNIRIKESCKNYVQFIYL
uniref:Uncharacterized protein n=1 Tax=Meloidogyne enterolobii TaxID=390850 RepID=A0A6V7VYC9_MELEN|nr:unnamed protein product [Meloidogyne enterolobii]